MDCNYRRLSHSVAFQGCDPLPGTWFSINKKEVTRIPLLTLLLVSILLLLLLLLQLLLPLLSLITVTCIARVWFVISVCTKKPSVLYTTNPSGTVLDDRSLYIYTHSHIWSYDTGTFQYFYAFTHPFIQGRRGSRNHATVTMLLVWSLTFWGWYWLSGQFVLRIHVYLSSLIWCRLYQPHCASLWRSVWLIRPLRLELRVPAGELWLVALLPTRRIV